MLYIIKTIVSSYSNDDLLESFHQHLECLIFLVVSINVFLLKKEQQKINISKNCTHISIFMKILFLGYPGLMMEDMQLTIQRNHYSYGIS